MKKNGFTLIELLTVIIVLALISLITVPIVLNLIEKTNKGAAENSAYGLRKASQMYYSTSLLKDFGGEDIIFNCDKINGCVSEKSNEKKITFDGSNPSNGKIEIKSTGEIIYSNIIINGYICKIENEGDIECEKYLNDNATENDTTAPNITIGNLTTTASSITIPYKLNEEAEVTCEYGTSDEYMALGIVENNKCKLTDLELGKEYFYKITATDLSNNSSSKEGSEIAKDTLALLNYTSGDAITLGGYNWHVISDDGTYVTLLMDYNQLGDYNSMSHCGSVNSSENNCDYNGTYYVYSWEKSKIRSYFTTTLAPELLGKINNMVTTEICPDPSKSGNIATYGGYLMSEINAIDGISCDSSEVVNDYVRLITYSEFWNLNPKKEGTSSSFPNVNNIIRIADDNNNTWLLDGTFWMMTASTGNAYYVRYAYVAQSYNNDNKSLGTNSKLVRPVITIRK